MADPVIVPCTAGVWTKVATNVTAGLIHIKDNFSEWQQTYKDTGGAAPTNGDYSTSVAFVNPTMEISASAGIDVYLDPRKTAGSVRVDL